MASQWYTIFSKPQKEAQVAHFLQNKGIEIYHPTFRVKPANPRSSKIRPFFPRYLFARADLKEIGTSMLQWIPGAVGLVSFGGEPAVVPEDFIRTLRNRLQEINATGQSRMNGLKRGDAVRIIDGPFAGYDAIFDTCLSGEDRVQVLLHWLGREMKTQLSVNAIEKRRKSASARR